MKVVGFARGVVSALVVALISLGASTVAGNAATATAGTGCTRPAGMVLVLGAHRNAPAPALDATLSCQVEGDLTAGLPVQMVVASGDPQLVKLQLPPVVQPGDNPGGRALRAQIAESVVANAVIKARPHAPGVDDLAALALAGDAARSAGTPKAELVLQDSGLDDRGALNFTVAGMLGANPSDVANQLKGAGELPDLTSLTVSLQSVGYTAPPQAPLADWQRTQLTRIWSAVLAAAGATVKTVGEPVQGAAVKTRQPVKSIAVPQAQVVHPSTSQPIVFDQQSAVSFQADSAAFVDPTAAAQALQPIAAWLAAEGDRHAAVEGTTEDVDSISAQIALSQQRAAAVEQVLVQQGASTLQITATGVGSDFPQYVRPDRDAEGNLLPGPAALNRSVRITLSEG